jgi:hypothetical protein
MEHVSGVAAPVHRVLIDRYVYNILDVFLDGLVIELG